MDIIFVRVVIFILILSIMVNTTFTGEHASNSIEQQAGGEEGKEIQAVKEDTSTRLGHLYKVLTLSTMIIAGPSVFGQQTTQKVEAAKSQQITAMKGGNDTAILANNGPTMTTPTKSKDQATASSIDTDKDGISDADEIKYGTDPKVRDDFFGATNTGATSDGGKNLLNSAEKGLAEEKQKLAEEKQKLAEEKQKLAEAKKLEEMLLSKPK